MAHSHALSGFALGSAAIPLVMLDAPLPDKVAWTAACGGFALLSDLDKRGTTAARTWGFPTQILARVVGTLARGHRAGTHDAILGSIAFAALAYVSTFYFWASLFFLALSLGLALHACSFAIPGRIENTVLGNIALSWGGAWLLLTQGSGQPSWLPAAVVIGVLAHIAGDALTPERVPIPILWIFNRRARIGLPLFTTGKPPEKIAAFLIGAAAIWLFALNTGAIAPFPTA